MTSPDLEPIVYRELRAIAGSMFRNERQNHTLQPTALVNEAWLRLAAQLPDAQADESERNRFLAIAANIMRQLLVDHARNKGAQKRGGAMHRVSLAGELPVQELDSALLIDLDETMTKLSERDERVGKIAELRIFGGLQIDEIAKMLKVSGSTVKTDWSLARAVISKALSPSS